jgi:RimJ/RimL family protein N-acetyltransferase
MADLSFRPLDESEMRMYATWFDDAELRRRIEAPTPQWFRYVTATPGIYAWLVYEADAAVGQVALDTDADQHGYFGLVVKPALRNQGYGKRILRAFLRRPEVTNLKQLEATVEPDNHAALRCCEQVGFAQIGSAPDDEGFLRFVYIPAERSSPAAGQPLEGRSGIPSGDE